MCVCVYICIFLYIVFFLFADVQLGLGFCTAGVLYLLSIFTIWISLCVYIDIYIYIHEYLCVCGSCSKYTVNVHVPTFLCSYVQLMPAFIPIALGGCTSPYTGKEPVSRCLLVRDSSVILQNPQSAVSSDGEEHVFMPQNTRKIRESGDRFKGNHDLSLM